SLLMRTTRQDALLHTDTTLYDAAAGGKIRQFTDRKGQVAGVTYDNLNRASVIGFGATAGNPTSYHNTIQLTYDPANRVTRIVDSLVGTITRGYANRFNPLTSELSPQGSVSYVYDAAGRRSSMSVQNQPTVAYAYFDNGLPKTITQGAQAVSFTYDAGNRRTTTALP